jgi:hypothetical protein
MRGVLPLEIFRKKIRLAVLWIFIGTVMASYMVLSFLGPGVINNVMSGQYYGSEINNGLILAFLIPFWIVPFTMAVICLSLRNSWNRWVNIIVGAIVGVIEIISLFNSNSSEISASLLLFDIASIVGLVFIIWWAWRLPKQEA